MTKMLLFGTGTLDGELTLNIDGDKVIYLLCLWDGEGDAMVQVDFSDGISKDHLKETRKYIQKMLVDEMEESYFGISWGRVEFLLKKNKSIDLIIYLHERPEYGEDENYLRVCLDESTVLQLFDFLEAFEPADEGNNNEVDEMEIPLTYMVGVFKEGKQLMELGLGMSAVVEFYDKVQSGIKGTISIERPFSYNVDVTIAGRDLLEFIETAYPTKLAIAKEIISGNESEIYTLVGYDMS